MGEDLAARVKELTGGVGVSRLVEASGAPPMVNSCFSLLRKGAKLVLIGLPKSAIHIENPLQNVIFKSITLTTVHGRRIFLVLVLVLDTKKGESSTPGSNVRS